ncbi:MAG: PEP/pyruvate-binding domain-containing protein [Actinomycetota bacterium]
MTDYIVWFDRYTDEHHARVGGKNASLGQMMAAGLPVPPGFAVTTEAYHTLRDHSELRAEVSGLLAMIDLADADGLERISARVRAIIDGAELPDELRRQVAEAYAELCERCEVQDVPVAVRSSATAEDLPDASFAGEHDTFLWVRGADAVLEKVRRCWSSVFTARAISYRQKTGHDHDVISMSVGVQKMVQPRTSGVAFTLNPTDGDRSSVAIDASWGLGEAVVGGEVNPDNFLVDKVMFEIVRRSISSKSIEYRVGADDRVEHVDVEPERQLAPCLTDDEVKAVARLARRAEKHYGHPQDIEWALDMHLPAGENVVLLQSRPETVWSRKPKPPIARPTGMDSIVSTLLSPLNKARKEEGAGQTHA